jgi:hypothetical protein
MGATGSGKTETLFRIVSEIARLDRHAAIFFLDGKGSRDSAARFVALMEAAGRSPKVFPNQPFSGWKGDGRDLQNRLIEIVDYATEGPAAFYRDIAKATLSLACRHPEGPPRSTREFLRRLDLNELAHAHSGHVAGLTEDQVAQVRMRYEAFFRQIGHVLDGLWSWEDADSGYLLLDSLALREESKGLARFLFEDFGHYFTLRKPRERLCVLVVDEYSALAQSGSMATRVDQAREFNTALLLAPHVAEGMGAEDEAKRILASVHTIVIHQINTPEPVVELAGTHQVVEWSQHVRRGLAVGEGLTRLQHQHRVDPNAVRALRAGEAFLISGGQALRMLVARADQDRAVLPQRAEPRVGGLTPPEPDPDAEAAVARELPY